MVTRTSLTNLTPSVVGGRVSKVTHAHYPKGAGGQRLPNFGTLLLTPIQFELERPNSAWQHGIEERVSIGQTRLHPKGAGSQRPANIQYITSSGFASIQEDKDHKDIVAV